MCRHRKNIWQILNNQQGFMGVAEVVGAGLLAVGASAGVAAVGGAVVSGALIGTAAQAIGDTITGHSYNNLWQGAVLGGLTGGVGAYLNGATVTAAGSIMQADGTVVGSIAADGAVTAADGTMIGTIGADGAVIGADGTAIGGLSATQSAPGIAGVSGGGGGSSGGGLASGLIGAAGNIIGSTINANANKAAASSIAGAAAQANQLQAAEWQYAQKINAPFVAAEQNGLKAYTEATTGNGILNPLTAYTPEAYKASTPYQIAQIATKQANDAALAHAAATGGSGNPALANALAQQDANIALTAGYTPYMSQIAQQTNTLANAANPGQINQLVNTGANVANNQGANITNAANNAAPYSVASSNAWAPAIQYGANLLANYASK